MKRTSKPAHPSGTAATAPSRLSMKPLGLDEPAEAVYRALLRQPGLGTLALSQRLGGTADSMASILAALQQRGLVSRSPDAAAGWLSTAPEVAVELLLMERQAELNEARRVLPLLQEDLVRDTSAPAPSDLQVVPAEPDAQLQLYLQMYEQARSSILTLVRPPFLVAAPAAIEAARDAARKRGVRIRSILAPEVMQWKGWREAADQAIAAGDQLRMLDGLPFKLLLVDGRGGMLPLRAEEPDGPVLRLGPTAALSALSMLFEQLWADATELRSAATHEEPARATTDAALRELLEVLAAGTNDKAAAQVLGISDRTLQRRLTQLNTQLHARTRFQCGWLAALRLRG